MDAFIDFTGGTLGGIANVYVGQPLDTGLFDFLYLILIECFS